MGFFIKNKSVLTVKKYVLIRSKFYVSIEILEDRVEAGSEC